LNDRLVREGDMFDGVRIVRIGEAEVEIEVEGRRSVVSF
jgi:CRP-like cAMP-binding protein